MVGSQLALSSQVREQLSAGDVHHQEVQITTVLSKAFEADLERVTKYIQRKTASFFGNVTYKEGVIDVCENCVLRDDVIDLAQLDDFGFLKSLHREVLARLAVLGKQHASKGAYTVNPALRDRLPVPSVVESS